MSPPAARLHSQFVFLALNAVSIMDWGHALRSAWPPTTRAPVPLSGIGDAPPIPLNETRHAGVTCPMEDPTLRVCLENALSWQRVRAAPLTLVVDAAQSGGVSYAAACMVLGAPEGLDECTDERAAHGNDVPLVLTWHAPMPNVPNSNVAELKAVILGLEQASYVVDRFALLFDLAFPCHADGSPWVVVTDSEHVARLGLPHVMWRKGRTGLLGKAAHEVATRGLRNGIEGAEHEVERWMTRHVHRLRGTRMASFTSSMESHLDLLG